jgi:AraC-like DNA-binding protein
MDVLADILAVSRLRGDVFSHSLCTAPWGMRYAPRAQPWFHIVASGTCLLRPNQQRERRLATHDLVLLPHGIGHVLCDSPDSKCIDVDPEIARTLARPTPVSTGRTRQSSPRAEIVCGSYAIASTKTDPVLALLPAVIHIPGQHTMAHPGLQDSLALLLREFAKNDVGGSLIVTRLLEVLFVQVLRYWLDTQPAGSTGWLGGLRDEPIGRALVALHTKPESDWTVRSLASEVGLSRPVLARRFQDKVGEPPLAYLRRLRIDLAARMLEESTRSLGSIAAAVGYTSEFAFNRAFHRARGMPPGAYRRLRTHS